MALELLLISHDSIKPTTKPSCLQPSLLVTDAVNEPVTLTPRELRALFQTSIRCEVLPDLLQHVRIDHPGVPFLRLSLRIQHELGGPALRPERAGVKDVETFVDHVALGDVLFELERVDWRHL